MRDTADLRKDTRFISERHLRSVLSDCKHKDNNMKDDTQMYSYICSSSSSSSRIVVVVVVVAVVVAE